MSEQPQTHTISESCDEEEINLLELLLVVVRRKTLIIKICAVAAVLSVCYSLTLKNTYTATAKFYPPQKETPIGSLASLIAQAVLWQALAGWEVPAISIWQSPRAVPWPMPLSSGLICRRQQMAKY